jgi:unsaturated pyranuronate lyase
VPIVEPAEMLAGEPLPGWHGRYFHAENMTFSLYEIAADATPLHEHHHPEEEVWNVVEGEIVVRIDGTDHTLGPGSAAVVPPDTLHAARAVTDCKVIVADHPARHQLPGDPTPPGA